MIVLFEKTKDFRDLRLKWLYFFSNPTHRPISTPSSFFELMAACQARVKVRTITVSG